MNTAFVRLVSRILIVCMVGLPLELHSGTIGTDAVVTAAQASAARDAVNGFLYRAEVAGQLQLLGLTAQAAKERADAMTDAEIVALAGKIERLPAGADAALGIIFVFLFLMWRFFVDPELAEKDKGAAKKAGAPRDLPKDAPKK